MKEEFSWRYLYWYLAIQGIQHLRDYLHLTPEIVPVTVCCSRLRLVGQGVKVFRASTLQVLHHTQK